MEILEQCLRASLSDNDFVIPTDVFVEWVQEKHGVEVSPEEALAYLDANENIIRAQMGVGLLGEYRYHTVNVDNEKDAKSVQRVVSGWLTGKGIIPLAQGIYPYEGEYIVEFPLDGGRRNKFGDLLEAAIERANIRWTGGGYVVVANQERSPRVPDA